jgi:hypothetical protein
MAFTGGPYQIVGDVFDRMWMMAQSRTGMADEAVQRAVSETQGWTPIVPPQINEELDIPQRPDIEFDPNQAGNLYDDVRQALEATIDEKLDQYLSTYFPSPTAYSKAMSWLEGATQGGVGIDPTIERQLWERDRTRVLNEASRAEAEAASTWANRGFSLPPGALAGQVHQIRLETHKKLSEQSRDIAIKRFDTGLDNARFAVKTIIDASQTALSAASDYIKTVMMGPQLASELALSQVDAKVKLVQSLTSLYAAEVGALDPVVKLAAAQGDINMRGMEANARGEMVAIESRVRAATSFAEMLGAQAAAGLNALNASASISGSSSDSTTRHLEQ